MKSSVQPPYDNAFFDYTSRTALRSARKITSVVRAVLPVSSVLDVGCAQGAWLRAWSDHHVEDLQGLDGSYVDTSRMLVDTVHFKPHDLSQAFSLGRRYDLVQSLEVAEHLPASRARGFVSDLTAHGDTVLFSAAPPGQGGAHHVNEQPYEYWRGLFAEQGYAMFDCVRPVIRDDRDVAVWYRYNTFVFLRTTRESEMSAYLSLYRVPDQGPVRDISPWVYKARKLVVRVLPESVKDQLARAAARFSR